VLKVSDLDSISGHGIVASYLEKEIFVGSPRGLNNNKSSKQVVAKRNSNANGTKSGLMKDRNMSIGKYFIWIRT
jgi:cation transport ATPase